MAKRKRLKWLLNRGDRHSLYTGVLQLCTGRLVVREKGGSHYVTKDELSSDNYAQFCKGSMYVLLASLLPKMLDLSRQVTRIGPDDALVGLLTDQLGISTVGVEGLFWIRPNIYMWFMSEYESRDLLGISDSLIPSQFNYR